MNEHVEETQSERATWIVVFLLVLLILFKGALSLSVIGDLGQPTWDFRPVRDVPGESPYAIYRALPHPQHIMGSQGE